MKDLSNGLVTPDGSKVLNVQEFDNFVLQIRDYSHH